MPNGNRLLGATALVVAAAAILPSGASAAPVLVGPAGSGSQIAIGQLTSNGRAVRRFRFVYIATCADGGKALGWTGFNFPVRVKRGRFALVNAKAGIRRVTVRGRRTSRGLTGTVKVVTKATSGATCTEKPTKFTITRRYKGGVTSQGYPWAVRIGGGVIHQLFLWSDQTCQTGGTITGYVSPPQDIPITNGAFSYEGDLPPEDLGDGRSGTDHYRINGTAGTVRINGTLNDSFTVTESGGNPSDSCTSGDLTFSTWR